MATVTSDESYTRRAFITDCVHAYVRNNPAEFQSFKQQVKERRANLFDPVFGQMKKMRSDGTVRADEDEFRLALSIPDKLWNALKTFLTGEDNERFGEPKGEIQWFAKNFPDFFIPQKF